MGTDLMTSSRMRSALLCPRHHYHAYEQGYRARSSTAALRFGTIFHSALETWWLCWLTGEAGDAALNEALSALAHAIEAADAEVDPFTEVVAQALLFGYHTRWAPSMPGIEVLAVEKQFRAPSNIFGWDLGGKIDAIVRVKGLVYVVEHKTTSADLKPGAAYWTSLRLDSQVSFYHRGLIVLGYGPHEIGGCLYDVVKKPNIRPKKATAKIRKKKDGNPCAGQQLTDETPDHYFDRLVKSVQLNPDAYYRRTEVVRLEDELREADADVLGTILAINAGRRRNSIPPRNTGACFRYHSACEFFDVCSGTGSLDNPHKFVQLDSRHPELDDE